MEVKQIYELVNQVTKETLGETAVLNEDLSNLVDIGEAVFNSNAYDKYVKSLVNQIGKIIFVTRPYRGSVPSVMMDGWEFGSVLQKIQGDLPEATENETWELQDGASYDPNIFYQPKVSAKFFNSKVTFEVPMSFTELQVKQSFQSLQQLNSFLSMLFTDVENAMTLKIDELIMRIINNMTAETIASDYADLTKLNASSGIKAVNLLYKYNNEVNIGTALTADKALYDLDFLKYASYTMKLYKDRIAKFSTLFNVGGKKRFTPEDRLTIVLLSEFASSADSYLQSDTFHDSYVKLPNAQTIAYWQGSGTDYKFTSTSKIDVKTKSGSTVSTSGILGVMFDRYALGVTNPDRRVTSNYNPKAEFYSNWYKYDASYFNDLDENYVVFFIA